MHQAFSTAMTRPSQRHLYWREVIKNNYFPLTLSFQKREDFQGNLAAWQFGELSLSRLESDPLCYRRQQHHLIEDGEGHLLVTIPEQDEVYFTQRGRSVQCPPGSFLLERSDEPYEFSYSRANSLWVVKVPAKAIRQRVGSPERFCAIRFDATAGSGAFLADYTRLLSNRLAQLNAQEIQVLSRQYLDLLALALENGGGVRYSSETAVQAAHVQRIQHYIRSHLARADLTPQLIADVCGISLRYLHTLFKQTGCTVGEWIKEQRLQACYDALSKRVAFESIAQIAYSWGFSDQAHFCRIFKERFGCTPSELRARYRS